MILTYEKFLKKLFASVVALSVCIPATDIFADEYNTENPDFQQIITNNGETADNDENTENGSDVDNGENTENGSDVDNGENTESGSDVDNGENSTIVPEPDASLHTHDYQTIVTKATTASYGKIVTKCSTCEYEKNTTTIYPIKKVSLSATSRVYNGKAFKPSVTATDIKGNKIPSKYYTVNYSTGCKNAGTYNVSISFKGNYSGKIKKTFKITKKNQQITSKNITVTIDSKKKLPIKGVKEKAKITYRTGKKSNVSISKAGIITGKRLGKSSITITTAATKNYKSTSTRIYVTVKPKPIKINKCISTANTTKKKNRKIKYIVLHYTAGVSSKKGSAYNITSWYPSTCVSSDFVVDDGAIVQYNGDIQNRYTYHCGGDFRYATGGDFFKKANNKNSIGIEMCSTNTAGYITFANDSRYSFSDAVVSNTLDLVRYLMYKYDIDADHVIRHYDVNGKLCPGIYGWNPESGSEKLWEKFKKQL